MRRIAGALGAFLALAPAAEARQHFPSRGHRLVPEVGPLDNFTTPSGAYSFRKLKSTYAGPAVRIRRASDNLETNINFLGCTGFSGCPIDTAAANAHCAATTCYGRAYYDQSGNGRDMQQATPASQPQLVFNCNAGLPCWRGTAGEYMATVGTVPFATGIVTFAAVAKSPAGCANSIMISGTRKLSFGGDNTWYILAGGVGFVAPATNAAWHSGIGVINGASSVVRIDGAETTGTGGSSVGAATVNIGTCNASEGVVEHVFWDNYVLTATERAGLQTNQKSFWGTP